jgi:NADH-ubiquinone oxidoreductase chain 5
MYLILICLPLISSVLSGFFGRFLGHKGSGMVTVVCLGFTFLISIFIFYEVAILACPVYIKLADWINSETLNIDWGFQFDTLTVVMCCIVTFVSMLVHLYSLEYMSSDPHLPRFMSYLSLFTFFMLILVTADNFIQLFLGWEGVGVCSYLLINFWFTRIQANKAAIKAMILNRIGDFGLIIGILIIFVKFKAVDYATVFSLVPFFNNDTFTFLNFELNLIETIGFFLFVGAMGKSAQLGLHTWLPDAMEGPTPVSALIHAATMVTAGIFLLARTSPIFEFASNTLSFITVIGASTAFFAATIGLLQNDLKRVIAYSTCSQLGYMVFACGLSNYAVGIFHLINHAFFKALLFLGAGSVIHSTSDEQDMRKMGGLRELVPFTYSMMVIGSLALIGFPFLTGFYSKDAILEIAYGKYTVVGHYSYLLGTLAAFFTAFYSTRLIFLTFLSKPNGFKVVICRAFDSSYLICISLAALAVPSIFFGYYTKDMFIGLGTDFWGNSLYVHPDNYNRIDSEFIPVFYKLLPVFCSIFGLLFGAYLYICNARLLYVLKTSSCGTILYNFLNRKWFFDKVYNECISQFFLKFGYNVTYKIIDKGIFETFGPKGLSDLISVKAYWLSKLQTNNIYHYTFLFLIAVTYLVSARHLYTVLGNFIDFRLLSIFFVLSFYLLSDNFVKNN